MAAQKLRFRYDEAKTQLQNAEGELQQRRYARMQAGEGQFRQAIAAREAALADPKTGIKGWGKELGDKLTAYAQRAFGISPQELAMTAHPGAIKALHRAFEADEAAERAARAKRAERTTETQPAPKPTANAGTGSRDITKLGDGAALKVLDRKLAAMGR